MKPKTALEEPCQNRDSRERSRIHPAKALMDAQWSAVAILARLFKCRIWVEAKIRKDYPLRKIKQVADQVLKEMNSVFNKMYSHTGRPSIPPKFH